MIEHRHRMLLLCSNPGTKSFVLDAFNTAHGREFWRGGQAPPGAVRVAESLGEARLILSEMEVDVLLADVDLPDGQGIEVLETLSSWRPGIPLVGLAANASEEFLFDSLDRNIPSVVLLDHCTPALLIREIRRAIGQQELIDDLERTHRVKSEFLANVSHEIRTPLSSVIGFTDILLDTLVEYEEREAAATIRRNAESLLQLVDDLLDLSRIESGRAEISKSAVSPERLVRDTVAILEPRARARNLPLLVEFRGSIPEKIITDPNRLRQILVNLIDNAIKYTEAGRVVVRVSQIPNESQLAIDVVDTGIGIDPEKLSMLFRPFSQLDGSATRKHGGVGLGLVLSLRLAELLGGTIRATSVPGKGSVFTVLVATGALEGVARIEYGSPQESRCEAPLLKGIRVLIAEDGIDNQRLIHALLTKKGAEVDLAENGRLALEKAIGSLPNRRRRWSDPNSPYDVILMDMQMPEMDGYEATSNLRQLGYDRPIVALTAHAMAGDREKCLAAGCDDYISKPIDRQKLMETILKLAPSRKGEAADARGSAGEATPAPCL